MLSTWWRDARFPRVDQLTPTECRLILDKIAELDWSCRPYEATG